MNIVEATKTEQDFNVITNIMALHPEPEYDCTFAEYKVVFKQQFASPQVRAWVGIINDKAIGYVIAQREYVPKNQINIIQIFCVKEAQNNGCSIDLLKEVVEWGRKSHAIRIVWSSEYNEKVWYRLLRTIKPDSVIKGKYSLEWEVK